ncbi:hypothetical protein KS4_28910 [Poriferisphaera corsica]|uniref:Uncharacterized protein n=1 Tax=Poriferisphaera corsica TaxID=2528020 RepID=A0A517YX71_9BACT|nr:transposase [Poriferisphaera corsica]QDU34815.1 hypothetical protein KS4_28910 [Poriferisphaera corsica]
MNCGQNHHLFHVILHTYGSWLPGDPKGFRAVKHKKHCEGDWKNPPPNGLHNGLLNYSQSISNPVVSLNIAQRRIVAEAIADNLNHQGAKISICSVSEQHAHLLGEFPIDEVHYKPQINQYMQRCKTWAAKRLRDADEWGGGTLWAQGSKVVRINDRRHWDNVYAYIKRHVNEHAYIYQCL